MSLKQITVAKHGQSFAVDVIAIHGSFEDDVTTWTYPNTTFLWLRDLLQYELPTARILTYGYDVASGSILDQSMKLLAVLNADRELCDAVERPLIFICHGLGGIIVKRALAHSSTENTKSLVHRRSLFVSTYAIIFLATPHDGFDVCLPPKYLKSIFKAKDSSSNEIVSLIKGSATLQDIEVQFEPLTKRFSIYCFWEQLQSTVGGVKCYIVDKDSAVPPWDDIEQTGLNADHSRMCKFRTTGDDGFIIILAALKRYMKRAIATVSNRWAEDLKLLKSEAAAEAAELLRDTNILRTTDAVSKLENHHFDVPRPARRMFTGRSDVARMVQAKFFSPNSRAEANQHRIFVLYGLGGAGKTEFCLKFAQDNKEQYWGVFWIDASTSENAKAGFATLGSRARKGDTFEAGKFWLASQRQPWLLVIDNADDPNMDITRYIPGGNSGHILITTQNPNSVMHATVGEKLFRDMDPDDAVSLLLKAADPAESAIQWTVNRRSIASEIAKALGYLALALVNAGTTIQRKICKLEEYLGEYTKNRKEMMSGDASATDGPRKTMIATWEVPYKHIKSLSTTEANDAIDILHVFAFLHFEHIPEVLFEKFWGQREMQVGQESPKSSFTETIAKGFYKSNPQTPPHIPVILDQAGPHWNRSRFRKALALLTDYSLIYYDAKRNMCYMHPVIHAWARDRLAQKAQSQWLNISAAILAGSITRTMEPSGREYRRSLCPHIDACLDSGSTQIDDQIDQGDRSLKFAAVYAECGRWKSAAQIQRHVVEVRRRTRGANHPGTLEAMHDLGQSCWNLFNPREAVQVQSEILRAQMGRFSWLGRHGTSTLKTLNDLGRTYWLLGNRREAERLGSIAVVGLTQRLGEQDPATLNAMHNLGCAYIHLSQPDRAAKLLERVLITRTVLWGLKHDDTLATMNELSMAYLKLGRHRYADAEILCRQALNQRKTMLGEEHAYTLWSVNNLAKILCARGRCGEAVDMLERILPVVTRTLGEAHVGMSMTKYNLACAYAGETKWSKAEDILKAQLEHIPPSHPDWIAYMSQLARVCERGGRQIEAQGFCVRAIKHYGVERALKSKDPDVSKMVKRLTEIRTKRGEIEDQGQLSSYLYSPESDVLLSSDTAAEHFTSDFAKSVAAPVKPDDSQRENRDRKIHVSRTW